MNRPKEGEEVGGEGANLVHPGGQLAYAGNPLFSRRSGKAVFLLDEESLFLSLTFLVHWLAFHTRGARITIRATTRRRRRKRRREALAVYV